MASDDWSTATAFCADTNGNLYAVTISGEILVGSVKRADASNNELSRTARITRILQPYPALDFVVTHATASPSGQLLILAGFHEGGEEPELAVVHTRNTSRGTSDDKCRVSFVDQQTYWDKPGLKFHQLQWHPYSAAHFVVLTSDSRFRIYSIHNLTFAEQVFHLKVNSGSLGYGVRATSALQQVTSFCFGPPAAWGFFTVFFITSTGAIYSLCPVAPFGMVCPAPSCHQLEGSSAAAAGKLWLQTALVQEGPTQTLPGQPSKVRATVSDMTVALQGPINESSLQEEPAAQLSGTCRVAAAHYTDYDVADGFEDGSDRDRKRVRPLDDDAVSQPVYCTALLAVDARGRACGYLLTRECSPCWVDVRGEAQEDARGLVTSISHSCEREPALESPLELLDLLDLGLDQRREEALQGGHSTGAAENDSDEEEIEEDVYLQLLASSQELPGQFWLGHHSGVWLISLPWLRVIAESYADADNPSEIRPPTLPEITEHCISTSSSRSMIGIALMDSSNPLLPGGERAVSSCMCASLDVERGVTLHWPMIALPDAAGERLQAWGLPKATELDSTVEAQHQRLLAGLDKISLPKPPTSQSKEQVLKYLVDSTACLTRHYSPYCQTAHDDLQLRVQQLHDEAYSQAEKADMLLGQLKLRRERQAAIEERIQDLKTQLLDMCTRVDTIMERHASAPRPLAPQEQQILNDVLPAMREHVKQLENSWQRVHARVASALQQQQADKSQTSSSPAHTPYGRRGPYGVSIGPPPASPGMPAASIPDSQAAKLFQKMEINNSRLKDAQRKLAMMEARLQAHLKNKAAEQVALQLQPLAERDDED